MIHLNNGGIKGILNRNKCLYREVVCATHPFTDFRLTLTQFEGKVLLLQTFLMQNIMYPVNNTISCEMKLSPFTLKECEEYFAAEQIALSRYDIVQSYMVFGGIPYYLSYFRKGLSFEGNTDRLFFGRNPKLKASKASKLERCCVLVILTNVLCCRQFFS